MLSVYDVADGMSCAPSGLGKKNLAQESSSGQVGLGGRRGYWGAAGAVRYTNGSVPSHWVSAGARGVFTASCGPYEVQCPGRHLNPCRHLTPLSDERVACLTGLHHRGVQMAGLDQMR